MLLGNKSLPTTAYFRSHSPIMENMYLGDAKRQRKHWIDRMASQKACSAGAVLQWKRHPRDEASAQGEERKNDEGQKAEERDSYNSLWQVLRGFSLASNVPSSICETSRLGTAAGLDALLSTWKPSGRVVEQTIQSQPWSRQSSNRVKNVHKKREKAGIS